MSNTDSFIDEVTEEVRRDKLFALMRKYGWIGILAVILLVGGAAVNEWRKATAASEARAFGDAVTAAMTAGDPAAALAAIPAEGDRRAVLAFLASATALDADDRDAALAKLGEIAADPALPESYRQLAQLKSVLVAGADMPAADRDAILAALATPGAPFRALALEQQALVLVRAGETEAAIAAFRALLEEPGVTAGLQGRVTQLIVALGGETEAG